MTNFSLSIPTPVPFELMLSLEGKCAVVTGGSRGIGEAIVTRMVEAGASVVPTGRGQEAPTCRGKNHRNGRKGCFRSGRFQQRGRF
ncbi:SDR family NAD(P)-dependent oxidoreductase [Paenibacillus glucanolyticus]|uniref:SDR family NAD(P)-dependent oxidoreductase n=1 Tax=Paenibacillus glucanolyticus TaxID=59843 RepID=UPI000AB9479F|nr:SDR family NAD(P)-dependent oxidoreductase [Paenibacillus glucanolyticus]